MTKIEIDALIDSYIQENNIGNITANNVNEILKALNAKIYELETRIEILEQAPDVIELRGTFSYSGSVPAAGGSKTPTNSLQIYKNGTAQQATFTYTSNQSYASVNSSTGVVTFAASQSTSQRSATITASCTFEGQTYTKTATVSQAAYVEPGYSNISIGYGVFLNGDRATINDYVPKETVQKSEKQITNFVINENCNTILALAPTDLTLTQFIKKAGIDDDITSKVYTTTETYEGYPVKLYQFTYGGNLNGDGSWTIKFA